MLLKLCNLGNQHFMGFITKNEKFEREEFSFFSPTQIKFGRGKVSILANVLQLEDDLASRQNVLIVTDKGVLGAGLIEKVKAGFAGTTYQIKAIFDDVPPDSDIEVVNRAAALVKEREINLIVAVGGGSVMDTAKYASLLGTHGGEVRDYEGGFMASGPCVPIIAVPTTVGTGSEVSLAAVVKDHEKKTKITIVTPYLYPRMALLDPEMVATLPAKLVAYTGMDALTHAVESYVATEHQPLSDAFALIASEMIFDNIEAAVKEPDNMDARAKMQIAALMAGIAFSNAAVGAVHAIAHTVGGLYGIHHGLANGIALPYVMDFNLDACATRYAALSRAFGVSETGLSDIELARKAIDCVHALKASIGIPERFRELNVPSNDDAISVITEGSLSDLSMIFNPRPADFDDFKPLVEQVV